NLPSSGGGLIRYFDEYRSKISFKPGHIIVLVVIIIIIEIILYTWGYGFLGI
ncbi:preprotein translocase subunit Sec61beta, partial [Candidatus Woesearchaeota archaeon CG10_big_fil_rev_8_21_14_0_10_33_12]